MKSVHSVVEIRDMLQRRKRTVIEGLPFPRAAVLVPLFEKDNTCHLLLTRRTEQVKHHKGQISFPGGMADPGDRDLIQTALREAREEIGLEEIDVQVLGPLDDIVTITDFVVTPIVGLCPYPYAFQLSPVETAELIEVPLAHLLRPDCYGAKEIVDNGRKRIVESYQYLHHDIWGATARILKQFLELITLSRSA